MVPQRAARRGHVGVCGRRLDCPYGLPVLFGHERGAGGPTPLSSNRDWLLLAAWVMVMIYFYLACYHPATHFGIFLLPLVLGLIVAARFADPTPVSRLSGSGS